MHKHHLRKAKDPNEKQHNNSQIKQTAQWQNNR
jgi:hypothetical protein